MARDNCTTFEHSLVNMTAETIKNLEAFFGLKEELQKMKNQGVDKLAMAIAKRKQVKKHLDNLIKSITATKYEIDELQDENNLLLTELVSLLEPTVRKPVDETGSPFETKDYFLSELKSLTDDSSPDDTAETLKIKIMKSVEMSEEKFREAEAIASEFDKFKKLKITVTVTDEDNDTLPTVPWLENGFKLLNADGSDGLGATGRFVRQNLTLLSHIILSLIRRQGTIPQESVTCTDLLPAVRAKVSTPSASSAPCSQPHLNAAFRSDQDSEDFEPKSFATLFKSPPKLGVTFLGTSLMTLPPTVPAANNFTIGQSKFFLKVYKSGVLQGEIQICPVPTFYPDFVKLLGDFCYKSPKIFSETISKVIQLSFRIFPLC